MRNLIKILTICVLGFTYMAVEAQEDTLKVKKEEILLSSEMTGLDGVKVVEYELKPIFKYVSPWERTAIIKFGFSPSFRRVPGDSRVEEPGRELSLRFEKKLGISPFSLGLESAYRLYGIGNKGYDYSNTLSSARGQVWLQGRSWSNGSYFTNKFSANVFVRFFYQQKKRLRVKASGNNFAQSFVYFKLKDLITYTRIRTFTITTNPRDQYNPSVFQRLEQEKEWILRQAYFTLGWGTQHQVWDNFWAELQFSLGTKLPGYNGPLHYDSMIYEVNLFFGVVLGKKKSLKK